MEQECGRHALSRVRKQRREEMGADHEVSDDEVMRLPADAALGPSSHSVATSDKRQKLIISLSNVSRPWAMPFTLAKYARRSGGNVTPYRASNDAMSSSVAPVPASVPWERQNLARRSSKSFIDAVSRAFGSVWRLGVAPPRG